MADASDGENEKEIRLMVSDVKKRDSGRNIARIDLRTMRKLGISAGDVVEIVGKRTTSALAWPAYSEDQNRDIIRIDNFTRKNVGAGKDEYIIVRPVKVKNALNVTLAPVNMRLNVDEDFTDYVKNRLMERTMVNGDTTSVSMLGHVIPFIVTKTRPRGIVRVQTKTKLTIFNEPRSIEIQIWGVESADSIKAKLASFNELNDLDIEIEVLEREYEIISENVRLKVAIIVKFKELKQIVVFHTRFLRVNLSEFLHVYKCEASNQLETVKDEIRECGEEVGFPLKISLLDIGRSVVENLN